MSFRALIVALLIFWTLPAYGQPSTDLKYIRQTTSASSVIVFVHGVLGDNVSAWTNKDAYWPKLIADDPEFKNEDVYVYEYPTTFFGPNFSIDEIAEDMRLRFDADRVSKYKELIFIGHSMGGLAIRAYLLKYRELAARTRLIYFLSTPTTGSEIASIASIISQNPQLAKMVPMQSSEYLADLQRQWLAANFNIPSFCAYETRKTYGTLVVSQASAASLCTRHLDPVNADHIQIAKPASTHDTVYIAFKSAFESTQSSLSEVYRPDCSRSEVEVRGGMDAMRIDQGECRSKTDPEKGIRVRYVWLDARSISLLIAGEVRGVLAQSMGHQPFIINNAVTAEVKFLIGSFGSESGRELELNIRGFDGAQISGGAQISKPTMIYDAEEETILPEPEAHIALKQTGRFPNNYSMYYTTSTESDENYLSALLSHVIVWRYVTPDDLNEFSRKTRMLRDLVMKNQIQKGSADTLRQEAESTSTEFRLSGSIDVPRSIRAMRYFTRAGMPEGFLAAYGDLGGCIRDAGLGNAFILSIRPRKLFVLVAVLENVDPKRKLSISDINAEQILSSRVRHPDEDGNWTPTKLYMPGNSIEPEGSIIIPLQMQLRAPVGDADTAVGSVTEGEIDPDDTPRALRAIRMKKGEVLSVREDSKLVLQVRKSAFTAPDFPEIAPSFTYGPRIRLKNLISDSNEIPIRPFDPSRVGTHYGYGEGSCPNLYVEQIGGMGPISYGRVLVGATSENLIRTDSLVIKGPVNAIEIIDDEPEISRIKLLKVFVLDILGNQTLVWEQRNLTVMPGLPLRVELPALASAASIRVEVTGFYNLMASLRRTSGRSENETPATKDASRRYLFTPRP
jgi:pimeloyl-ACP methyl ester carboxylesterase